MAKMKEEKVCPVMMKEGRALECLSLLHQQTFGLTHCLAVVGLQVAKVNADGILHCLQSCLFEA